MRKVDRGKGAAKSLDWLDAFDPDGEAGGDSRSSRTGARSSKNLVINLSEFCDADSSIQGGSVIQARILERLDQLAVRHKVTVNEIVDRIRQLAEYPGNNIAQWVMAVACYWGRGVEEDRKLAGTWCDKAAQNGNVEAQALYEDFCGDNSRMVFHYVSRAAEAGHLMANFKLGKMYLFGNHVKQDTDLALRYLKISASENMPNGFALAGAILRDLYRGGGRVPKDDAMANHWDIVAVNCAESQTGSENRWTRLGAYCNLALITVYGKCCDYEEVEKLYRRALAGVGERIWVRTVREAMGKIFVRAGNAEEEREPSDFDGAVAWYRKGIQVGSVEACFKLASLYDRGGEYNIDTHRFYGRDKDAAQKLYEKGFELAVKNSDEFWLAHAYDEGEGCSQDRQKAAAIFQKLHDSSPDSEKEFYRYRLQRIYYKECLDAANAADKVKWLHKAVGLGEIKGYSLEWGTDLASLLCDLAGHYQDGDGTRKNEAKAQELYRKAYELRKVNGDWRKMADMLEKGLGVPCDDKKAERCYKEWLRALGVSKMTCESYYGSIGDNDELPDSCYQGKYIDFCSRRGDYYLCKGNSDYDPAEAVRWFVKGAEFGGPELQIRLGDLYAEGVDIPKDLKKAELWYGRAFRFYKQVFSCLGKRSPDGIMAFARLYATGRGTRKNYSQAIRWACVVLRIRKVWIESWDPGSECFADINKSAEAELSFLDEVVVKKIDEEGAGDDPVYFIDHRKCLGEACGHCVNGCDANAIFKVVGRVVVNPDKCVGCGKCVGLCESGAICYG